MGKYVRKSRGSLAVVEVRTAAAVGPAESPKRRRKTAPLPPERSVQTSSLQPPSSRIVMPAGSSPSSTAACPAAEVVVASDEKENEGFQRLTSNFESSRGRISEARQSTSSSWPAEAEAATSAMEAEIERFFLAAETEQALRFADKYNYDVIGDGPLDGGRFEWIGIDL